MTLTLDSIRTATKPLPPKIVIYGTGGVGKTTFACAAPSPIVIRTEDRLGLIQVPAFPLATDYTDIIDAITLLYRESHQYKTVVLDSLDWTEPLVWAHTARENQKSDIEAFGYGKGYLRADEYWMRILNGLNALRAKGMLVICVAHSQITRFESPETVPYDRHGIKLHKRAAALVSEWADIIGFAKYEVHTQSVDLGFNRTSVRGIGTGDRLLALEERPAFDAKNSYALPAEMSLDYATFRTALRASFDAVSPATTDTPTDSLTNATTHTEDLQHA